MRQSHKYMPSSSTDKEDEKKEPKKTCGKFALKNCILQNWAQFLPIKMSCLKSKHRVVCLLFLMRFGFGA